MALSAKREKFVEEYIKCLNGSEAARRAQYANPGQEAYRLLRDPEVRAEIDRRLETLTLKKSEILSRLTDQALGLTEEYLTKDGLLDLDKLREAGKLHLVKRIERYTTATGVSVWKAELYDAQTALVHLGRHYALFTDKTEHSGAVTWRELVEQATADDETG